MVIFVDRRASTRSLQAVGLYARPLVGGRLRRRLQQESEPGSRTHGRPKLVTLLADRRCLWNRNISPRNSSVVARLDAC